MSNWDDAEEVARHLVLCATAPVKHDKLQGALMIAGFAATDYVLNAAYAVEQIVKLPWRVLRVR